MKVLSKYMNKKNILQVVESFSFLLILVCVYCSIKMNIVGRTLWLDEAMLAISLNTRSLWNMFLEPLAWNQSAPVGYVTVIKFLISVLGNSEFVFRLFSIISYILLLVVFYFLSKKILKTPVPILCTAGVANIAYLLEYSNMFKPYICDALCVMLVLFLYYLYKEEKIKLWFICGMYFILIWFSNPVAFFTGGVVAYEVLAGIFKKDKSRGINGIFIGISICVSFLIMYIVWLEPTIAGTNLSEFWTDFKFPLMIQSLEELDFTIYLIKFITQNIGPLWKVVLFFAFVAMLVNVIWKRNDYVWAISFAIAITFFASALGFFPMSDRLFLFMIPVWVLLAMFALHWMIEVVVKTEYKTVVAVVLLGCFMISGTGITTYKSGEAYRAGEEANESLQYIQDNLTKDDLIYVYYPAIPVFQYKMGYNTTSVCGYKDNVYFGHGFFYNNEAPEDIEYISQQKGIYVLFSHVVDYEPLDNLLNALNETGTFEKVKDTYLYYYSCDGSQSKADFSYELISAETSAEDVCTAIVRIHNNGDTFLNNGLETYRFHSTEYNIEYDGEESVIVSNITPGTYVDVTIQFSWNGEDSKEFSLYNMEKYDMQSLGIESIEISK